MPSGQTVIRVFQRLQQFTGLILGIGLNMAGQTCGRHGERNFDCPVQRMRDPCRSPSGACSTGQEAEQAESDKESETVCIDCADIGEMIIDLFALHIKQLLHRFDIAVRYRNEGLIEKTICFFNIVILFSFSSIVRGKACLPLLLYFEPQRFFFGRR